MKCSKEEKDKKRKEFEHYKRIGKFKLKGECSLCGDTDNICFHHIIPLSTTSGTNDSRNIIEVCYKCHSDIHGSLALISGPISDEQKQIISKANTKMMKLKYDFTYIDSNLYGECEYKGFEELIDSINDILTIVMNKGYKIRWSKTGKSPFATINARKTIYSYSKHFNSEYRVCRREYKQGYMEIYIPYKKGVA